MHACGRHTDVVIDRAIDGRARVALMACCHDTDASDQGGLAGWFDSALAIDATRVARLARHGYSVHTQRIPVAITPENRLLLATPGSASPRAG